MSDHDREPAEGNMKTPSTMVRSLMAGVALLLALALAPLEPGPALGVTQAEAQTVWGVSRRTARRTTRRVARRHAYLYSLPAAHRAVVVNNTTYYVVSGVYYVPAMSQGQVVYTEVPVPAGAP